MEEGLASEILDGVPGAWRVVEETGFHCLVWAVAHNQRDRPKGVVCSWERHHGGHGNGQDCAGLHFPRCSVDTGHLSDTSCSGHRHNLGVLVGDGLGPRSDQLHDGAFEPRHRAAPEHLSTVQRKPHELRFGIQGWGQEAHGDSVQPELVAHGRCEPVVPEERRRGHILCGLHGGFSHALAEGLLEEALDPGGCGYQGLPVHVEPLREGRQRCTLRGRGKMASVEHAVHELDLLDGCQGLVSCPGHAAVSLDESQSPLGSGHQIPEG
mmetsp:Transcript_9833/g.27877  ORF Transcript_9833/g.27877 Transcript_9833/m.27877 type:complete len:267 (-) Transcript_9833:1297-2097(-)